jgi:VWFA-related protein
MPGSAPRCRSDNLHKMKRFWVITAVALGVAGLAGTGLHAGQQPPATGQPAQQTPPAGSQQQPPAGQPGQPQPPKPVFRTGADLVRVDAVVLDKKGQPVTSLTADDFEVQEEGAAQDIRSFQYVKADGQPDPNNELTLAIRSRSHAAVEAARDNVRVFLIFWDEYHIGQMLSAPRARASLMHFVRAAFGPTDLVAFMDPLTPIDAITFTRDRLELFEKTRRLIGRQGVYVPTRSAVEDAHLERGDVERLRSEVTLSALKAATVHLGGLRDGRKSIILISEGLRGMMRDGQSLITDLVRSANDNNTAIYSIDPRGFGQQRFPSMFEGVADDTGGRYFRSNDLVQALVQVVTESSGFYLLGYSSVERPMDGRFHKIKVKVKGQGLEVRARSGYWAPSVSEMTRALAKAAESEVPVDVQKALGELPSATARRAIDFWIGAALNAEGQPCVRMSWAARPVSGPATTKVSQVTAVATQGETRVFEGEIGAGGAAFDAPSGPIKVTFNAVDDEGQIIDRDVRTVSVPDPSDSRLWMSSPALFRTQNALEYRNLDRSPAAMPFPGREFVRTDRVLIRFSVGGAADAGASARIVSQWGKDLSDLPLARKTGDQNGGTRPGAATDYEIDLPLSSVAKGEFLIAISAGSGADTVHAFVPIRITR